MALTDEDRLRQLIGEVVQPGKLPEDTMFSEEQIEDFLAQGQGFLQRAAYHGWVAKMGELANLVNVNEGNASREMGELHKNAKRMVDYYAGFVDAPSRGRARIGKIRRRTPLETS